MVKSKLFVTEFPNNKGQYFACEKGILNEKISLGNDYDAAVKQVELLNFVVPKINKHLEKFTKRRKNG